MRTLRRLVNAAAITVLVHGIASADDVPGFWLNEEEDACIEIAPCGGDQLCGRIVWLRDALDPSGNEQTDTNNPDPTLRARKILGLTILWGFGAESDASGEFGGGAIYDPNNGKTYRCKMRLDDAKHLKIRGFVGISLFGRTTTWTRVSAENLAHLQQAGSNPSAGKDRPRSRCAPDSSHAADSRSCRQRKSR